MFANWKKSPRRRDSQHSPKPHPATRNLESLVVASVFLLVVSAFCLVPWERPTREHDGSKEPVLLEVGGDSNPDKAQAVPAELKVVSYNIRYRAGDDLKQLIKLLKDDPEIGG